MAKASQDGCNFQILALGTAQTIAWASSTYLPAVVGLPMAASLGLSPTTVFAAFSVALLAMAALGPAVGRAIDRHGGRGVLCLSNGILAVGLGLLAVSSGPGLLFAAWALMGAGMALGLYDSAFAALVHQHGLGARRPITGITLLAGFASTIGWPLTSAVVAAWDWRGACLMWAAVHLLVALPLNWVSLPASHQKGQSPDPGAAAPHDTDHGDRRRVFILLALFGAASSFVTSAMAAHLPALLMALGMGAGMAIAAAALVGPAQVVARLMEFIAGSRYRLHPLASARIASLLHPVGGAMLLAGAATPWTAGAFAVLHGAGNGLLTIAKGTLPLAIFGAHGYGSRQGLLAVAQRGMQAAAPFAMALALEHWGGRAALLLTGALSGVAFLALLAIRSDSRAAPGAKG